MNASTGLRHFGQEQTAPAYPVYVERWAILVGISKYQHERLNLKYADRDAEALYRLLQTASGSGFDADYILKLANENATTVRLTWTLHSFLKKPDHEDIILIYFACHGAPDPDRLSILYLLTHDTDLQDISAQRCPCARSIFRCVKI